MDFEETQTTVDQAWLDHDQRVERVDPSGDLFASGLCRRCGDDTSYPIVVEDVAVAEAAGPVVSLDVTRMFRCRCAQVHDKRPEKVYTGCGAYWFARVTHDGAEYRLSLAPSQFVAGAVVVDQAVQDQRALVQSTAEKWLGAVTALLALFSIGGSVLAVDALDGLATWAQVVAAVAGVLALACGAAAVYFGHRAAFGWLQLAPTNTDVAAADLLRRAEDVGGRVRDFNLAVLFAFAALGLSVLALAVIWFGPA
jgi:protein-S-isoprenylcysteine O-methyltransferase Ste14